ncbi:MAG: B12-binding domain-containing radical SAM protein [Calditrichaceae bacterium]|nr:B12-binding domain-containing radical SAM protein [Calditrichaceae bacterium]
MNILLVNPETPCTFWSFRNALKFVAKKSSEPPLGLLTVAAMLPKDWSLKLVDMNVTILKDKQIQWADYVFLGGLDVQKESFKLIVNRCNKLSVPVVAGGPMCTMDHSEFLGVDHFVLNEAELTLPQFLEDLQNGLLKRVYSSSEFPDLTKTPAPMWELLDFKKYATISIQYSRGCPFNCDFCTITMLNGRYPRTKTASQFLAELTALYNLGWRNGVFIVDDNFIGNKKNVKNELLPDLIEWGRQRNYPFDYITETSINLADDEELIDLMVQAGFNSAFIGIETVNDTSLAECGKTQNLKRNMTDCVYKLHKKGIKVSGGFIVGFDSDPATIFEQMIQFIQNSGIVTAMVGLLNAPKGTKLFQRLKSEGRILSAMSGNNMDGSLNFIPKMDYKKLMAGYKNILDTIYSQKEFYYRVKSFLKTYNFHNTGIRSITWRDIQALFKSMFILGMLERGRIYYWKLFFFTLTKHPEKFALSITMAIYGFHFRKVIQSI